MNISTLSCLAVVLVASVESRVLADAGDDLYNLALGEIRQQRYEAAARNLETLVKDFPKHSKTEIGRFRLGLTYLTIKKYQPAREHLRKFVAANAESQYLPEAMYQTAYSSYQLGDLKSAAGEFDAFHKQFPKSEYREWSLVYQGYVQLQADQAAAARRSFESSKSEYPKGAMREDAEFGLARAWESEGKVDEAVKSYRTLADDPTGRRADQALLKLGNLYFDRQEFPKAAAEYETLITKFPRSALVSTANLNAGYAWFQSQKFESAATRFGDAAKQDSQRVTALYWKGMSHKELRDWDSAIDSLKSAAELLKDEPLAANVKFQWADCELRAGRTKEAIPRLLEAVAADPKGEFADDALYLAADSALVLGNLDEANTLFARLTKDFPERELGGGVPLLKGRLQLAAGTPEQLQGAEKTFQEIIAGQASPAVKANASFQRARALERLDRPRDAVDALRVLTETEGGAPVDPVEALVLQAECQRRLAAAAFLEARPLRKQLTGLKALPEPPDTADLERQIGELTATGETWATQASESLTRYLEQQPSQAEDRRVLIIRATVEALRGERAAAQGALDLLAKAEPDLAARAPLLTEIADLAYDRGDFEWARDLFGSLDQLPPDSPWRPVALSGRAWSQLQLKEFEAAAVAFGTLADEMPESSLAPESAFLKGDALRQAGKLDEAAAAFDHAFAKFSPAEPSAEKIESGPYFYANRAGIEAARIWREMKETERADAQFEKVLQRFPRQPDLERFLREWAVTNANAGRYERADLVFRKLLDANPTGPYADDARFSIAENQFLAGNLEAALPAFEDLVKNDKAEPLLRRRSLMHLMRISVRGRKWDDVRKQAEQYERQFPEGEEIWDARFYAAEALLNLGNVEAAAKVIQALYAQRDAAPVDQASWRPKIWIMLAEVELREKDYDRVDALAAEFKTVPDSEAFQYLMREVAGRGLKNRARFDEAITEFQSVINDSHGAKTETAAKSQFLIAEIRLLQKQTKVALEEYLKVYLLYEHPEWQAPALYQAGQCDELLEQWQTALTAYEDLRTDFPTSEFAKKASDRIDVVKKKLGN